MADKQELLLLVEEGTALLRDLKQAIQQEDGSDTDVYAFLEKNLEDAVKILLEAGSVFEEPR